MFSSFTLSAKKLQTKLLDQWVERQQPAEWLYGGQIDN